MSEMIAITKREHDRKFQARPRVAARICWQRGGQVKRERQSLKLEERVNRIRFPFQLEERPRNREANQPVGQRAASSYNSTGQKDHREKRARIVERTDNDMRSIRRLAMPWKKFLVIGATIQIIPARCGKKFRRLVAEIAILSLPCLANDGRGTRRISPLP